MCPIEEAVHGQGPGIKIRATSLRRVYVRRAIEREGGRKKECFEDDGANIIVSRHGLHCYCE